MFEKLIIPNAQSALVGRNDPLATAATHYVNNAALKPPFDSRYQTVQFGMGCFWGVEKMFWPVTGVNVTAVGYAGGVTPNPSYEEVCSGKTGQNEVVLVVFDPQVINFEQLLKIFFNDGFHQNPYCTLFL